MAKTARLYDHNSRSKQEVGVIDNDALAIVNHWIEKFKGCPDSKAKEETLKSLMMEVSKSHVEAHTLIQVVMKGHLLVELKSVMEQTRWLKAQKISFVDSPALSVLIGRR